MSSKRIGELLDTCGHTWLGGQRAQVHAAMQALLDETKAAARQSVKQSLVEAITGTAFGFCVALASQVWIMGYYGLGSTFQQDIGITLFFTGISIIRGYAVRRFFNWRHHK